MQPKNTSISLAIPQQQIDSNSTQQLHAENPMAQELAQPLFDAGIQAAGLARKKSYDSGSPTRRSVHIFMIVLQGEVTIKFGRLSHTLKAGMLCFCPRTVPFARATHTETAWLIYINLLPGHPFWVPLVQHGAYVRACESTDHMLLLLSRILDARRNPTILSRLDALEDSQSLAALLKREVRIVAGTKPHAHRSGLQYLMEQIHAHPEHKWSVQEMAKVAGTSPRNLSRLFKREYGGGPVDMVIRNRIDWATQLLTTTDLTVEQIAHKLGYKSVYSFSSLFKRCLGVRPGQFRRNFLADEKPPLG